MCLRIAQGPFNQAKHGHCIYLVDDLPSRTDEHHRRALCRLLEDLHCQVFYHLCGQTMVLRDCARITPVAMFHVEHGGVTRPTTTGVKA
jgi:DNA replication and repair protein RecF